MRDNKTLILVESGAMIAVAFILNMFPLFIMPSGGSVTLGSMVPILFLAWRRGPAVGILAGVAFGVLDFFHRPYFLHWAQFFLDYLLAFGVLGLAGIWKKRPLLGVTKAVVIRFIVHVASGVIFWSEGLTMNQAVITSTTYNASYMIPEFAISVVIMYFLTKRHWSV